MENKFDESTIDEGKHEVIVILMIKECDIDEFQCMTQSIIEGVKCIDPVYEYSRGRQIVWSISWYLWDEWLWCWSTI